MKRFVERLPELRKIEGWYEVEPNKRIKISCRFNDILRCSNTPHFNSCFRLSIPIWWPREKRNLEYLAKLGPNDRGLQPYYRCIDPSWAIAYLPDKKGKFQARSFIHYTGGVYVVDKVYGNGLSPESICLVLNNFGCCRYSANDTYLEGTLV